MANQGAIAFMNGYDFKQPIAVDEFFLADGTRPLLIQEMIKWRRINNFYITTSLSGYVKDAGNNPLEGYQGNLYYKSNGQYIMSTVTDVNGHYSFDHILTETKGYFIVWFDPTEVEDAKVHDFLTPGS